MSDNWLSRQNLLIGQEKTHMLSSKSVCIVGLGGVGGAAAEAILRAGVGRLILVDNDVFDETNLNRQILSTRQNIGRLKTDVARERLISINEKAEIILLPLFCDKSTLDDIFSEKPDYIIDAIDTVKSKVDLIARAKEEDIPLISSMGAGNRLRPELLNLGDIADTVGCGCGLARAMRPLLKKRGITDLRVGYSRERPILPPVAPNSPPKHISPGSISFMPPVMGYILAGEVIRELIK